MSHYSTLDYEDLEEFQSEINLRCNNDDAIVVASNAFFDGKTIRYYALIKIEEVNTEGFQHQVLEALNDVTAHLYNIESNTGN